MRRRFYELAAAGPALIASEALRRIAEFYKIEDDIRSLTAEARRAVRQERSGPILAEFEPWLREKLGLISQKTKLAEAIRYMLSRWEGLTGFIDDGRIEFDSNTLERSIRSIALNRKNALFAGSDAGAEHWAVVASSAVALTRGSGRRRPLLAFTIGRSVGRRAPSFQAVRKVARNRSIG